MKYLYGPWRRQVVRALVLALAVGAVPVNCLAAEPAGPPPPAPTLAASIQHAVQQESGRIAKAPVNAARRDGAAQAATESRGFFKTTPGVITLVLLAAGTGYALYSTSHDRITSPKVTYGGTWK